MYTVCACVSVSMCVCVDVWVWGGDPGAQGPQICGRRPSAAPHAAPLRDGLP